MSEGHTERLEEVMRAVLIVATTLTFVAPAAAQDDGAKLTARRPPPTMPLRRSPGKVQEVEPCLK